MKKYIIDEQWTIKKWLCNSIDLKDDYYFSVYKNGWKFPHEGKNFRTKKEAEKFINLKG